MHIIVLGAAAGGGLPQWNCGCDNCNLARSGQISSSTQSSIAISGDGKNWSVLNASPDLRLQFERTPKLHPTGPRDVPLSSVLVTNGDIDHIAGLLTLREMQPFRLFATPVIQGVLEQNGIFDALNREVVERKVIGLDQSFDLVDGIEASLFAVPGKVPLFMEDGDVQTDLLGEQTVGVALRCGSEKAFYIPGCALLTDDLAARLDGADLVMFDGTLWQDDEMVRAGIGAKTGKRMGHMSISGSDGSIASFADLDIMRKVFVHMNNTNPVLRPNSEQRRETEASGWDIAYDGMEIRL